MTSASPPRKTGLNPLLLVGTDFSSCATLAAREAIEAARELGGRVDILHVSPSGDDPGEEAIRWMRDIGFPPGRLRTRAGTPWVELARDAAERDARFLFIGTHGSGGFHPVGVGSTAARLASASSRPVVLVGPRRGAVGDSDVRMPFDPETRRSRHVSS